MMILGNRWPASVTPYKGVLARCIQAFANVLPVERVVLFGSHARGDAGSDSDVDLCVVVSRLDSQHRAAIALRRAIGAVRGKPALSIIPISTTRLREKHRNRDPFFDAVEREGVCIARRKAAK